MEQTETTDRSPIKIGTTDRLDETIKSVKFDKSILDIQKEKGSLNIKESMMKKLKSRVGGEY